MLFANIIYYDTIKVLVWNIFYWSLCILCHQRLGYIVDIYYNNCFLTNTKFVFYLVTVFPITIPIFKHKPSYISTSTNLSMEMILDNRVKIYGDKYAVTLLA